MKKDGIMVEGIMDRSWDALLKNMVGIILIM